MYKLTKSTATSLNNKDLNNKNCRICICISYCTANMEFSLFLKNIVFYFEGIIILYSHPKSLQNIL